MRTNILARQMRALSRATALLFIVGGVTACSNDVMRLDTMTTASVRDVNLTAKTPSADVDNYQSTNDGIKVVKREDPFVSTDQVSSAPTKPTATQAQPIVLEPRQDEANARGIEQFDQITTGSLAPAKPVQQDSAAPAGWHTAKGHWVAVQPGETIYNLSRRYGVPVSAILSANQMTDGNSVEAGSKILIPTYNYGASAPVSAPDHDPTTKASRASRGFQGQAHGRVAVPQTRVDGMPTKPSAAPEKPKTTSANRKTYHVVEAGDTLSGIARNNGVTMATLKQLNGMTSDTVRLGQKLLLATSASAAKPALDTLTTGSVPTPKGKPQSVKSARTKSDTTVASIASSNSTPKKPVQKSVSAFRWPAEGRVISKFGERSAAGTNDGINISMPVGTPVKASQNGTVIYSGSELEDFGNLILLSHADGWVSAYANASSNLVRRGQKVKRGQVIAKSGRSGNASSPQLHFELRKDSTPVNPLKHLDR